MSKKNLGVLVILKNRFITGLVTDGDLRRGLKNDTEDKNLLKLMTKNPYVVNENMPAAKALGIMNDKNVTCLPVVSDKDFKKKNKVMKGIIHIHSLLQTGVK